MTLYYAINKARSKTFGQPSVSVEFPLRHFPPHPYMVVFKFKDVQRCIAAKYMAQSVFYSQKLRPLSNQSRLPTLGGSCYFFPSRMMLSFAYHSGIGCFPNISRCLSSCVSSFLACRVPPLQVAPLPPAPLSSILPSWYSFTFLAPCAFVALCTFVVAVHTFLAISTLLSRKLFFPTLKFSMCLN